MDDEIRTALVKQGMGGTLAPIRCSTCKYLASTFEEEEQLLRKGARCPHCGKTNKVAFITLDNYIMVCDWIGEFAVSSNRRDHVSAIIMFCALVESIIETVKKDYLILHPEIASQIKDPEKALIKDVFAKTITQLLDSAPSDIKQLPVEWDILRTKRNNFLHGHSGCLYINQNDAKNAMDLTPKAIAFFIWLNNKYCVH